MEQGFPARPLGLYIHIPWCISRCAYCVFFSCKFSRPAFEHYLKLLNQEKELYRKLIDRPLSSVYFGGGTPSLLSAAEMVELCADLPLSVNAEISLEINPLQINESFVQNLQKTPVNRISLGIQSMDDAELKWLTRSHRADDIAPKIQLLRDAGYHNISGDLIYGLPQSTVAQVETNLKRMLELKLTHLSCYLLELHEDGPLAASIPLIPEDEILAEQYASIRKLCDEAGFKQYEISNFALPGYESRHNLLYWQSEDYLAWGAAACGQFKGMKYSNPASLEEYEANVLAGRIFVDSDKGQKAREDYIMMRLRLNAGLSFLDFRERFGEDFGQEYTLQKLRSMGLIESTETGFRLSDKALFISNAVIGELL